MAELSEFLGGLVTSISNARANSDLQTIKIAEEYAKNNLLQHFAVPRMRVDNVELNIPVAISASDRPTNTVYEPIDPNSFSSVVYKLIIESLKLTRLPAEVSLRIRKTIADQLQQLIIKLKTGQDGNAFTDFCKNLAEMAAAQMQIVNSQTKRRQLSNDELLNLQNVIVENLNQNLKGLIKSKPAVSLPTGLQVIVEHDKLREIKPENIIMIKMTVSEQGMEWISTENDKGGVISKLMPE